MGRIWEEIYEACKHRLSNSKKNEFVKSPCNSEDLDVTNGKEKILADCAVESVLYPRTVLQHPFEILLAFRNVELGSTQVLIVYSPQQRCLGIIWLLHRILSSPKST